METLVEEIIKELGPAGILVCGMFYLLYKPLRDMTKSLETINHNSSKIVKILEKEK